MPLCFPCRCGFGDVSNLNSYIYTQIATIISVDEFSVELKRTAVVVVRATRSRVRQRPPEGLRHLYCLPEFDVV